MPTIAVARSFRDAMEEFQDEGRGGPDDDTMIGSEIREWRGRWDTPEGFAAYTAALRAQSKKETPRPAGWVPCTTWWWVQGQDYLGRIALRRGAGGRARSWRAHTRRACQLVAVVDRRQHLEGDILAVIGVSIHGVT
jgi:predicted acetyltransferase